MKNLSTFDEIKNRKDTLRGTTAEILSIEPSSIKEDTFIVIFSDGTQSNINTEVYNQLK